MSTIKEDLAEIKEIEDTIIANKVANFAYTDEAYTTNDANGVTEFNINKAQNIPTAEPSVLKVNDTVLSQGYRTQASSITRMLLNHFLGRLSYNVNKVNDNFNSLLVKLDEKLGTANGIATLDNQGRVPYSQLPESAMEYKGQWNADTNTPTLADGTGDVGDMYIVSVAGTQNFGSGNVQFFVNDRIIYDGSVWSRLSAGDVKTVNNVLPTNGNVTLTANDVNAVPSSAKGQANGIATLDENARVPYSQLPTDIMSFDDIYPIGSIYISIGDLRPAFGEWEKLATGKTLWNDNTPDGREIEAGLPNITGRPHIGGSNYWGNAPQGAFYKNSEDASNYIARWESSQGRIGETYFSARDGETDTDGNIKTSGQVFGNSDTVQPPAIAVSMWKRTA